MASIHSETEWEEVQSRNKFEISRIDEITKCVARYVELQKDGEYIHFIGHLRKEAVYDLFSHLSKTFPGYSFSSGNSYLHIYNKRT